MRGLDIATSESCAPDESMVGSLLDRAALAHAVDGVDAVVHLAALMTWHPQDTPRLFEANVTGTYLLLQAAQNRGLTRFLFASSGEVYPELAPLQLPITEEHPTLPNSPYGMSKLLGEQMVRTVGESTGMPYTILRFAHTQAADELLDPNSFFSGPRFYVNAKISQLQGFPSSTPVDKTIAMLQSIGTASEQHYISLAQDGTPFRMGMCDVRDLCQGIALALVTPQAAGEIFNIGPRSSFDFDQAVNHLAQYTGLPVHNVRLFTTSYRYDTNIDKAIEILGYDPQYDIFAMIDDAAARAGLVADPTE